MKQPSPEAHTPPETKRLESEQLVDHKGIRILNLSTGISSIIFGARNLTFALYLGYIGFDSTLIGIMFTLSALVGATFAIPIGALADRWGRKKFIVVGRILQSTGILLLVFFTQFSYLLAGMMFQDIGMAASQSPLNALLADKSPSEKRNATFSRNYMFLAVGSAVGSVVSIVPHYLRVNSGFGSTESYIPLFAILFLAGLFSLFVVAFVRESKQSKVPQEDRQQAKRRVRLTSADKILKYSLTLSIIQLGAGMIITLFSYWLNRAFGVQEMELAPLYVIVNLSMGLGYYLANWLASQVGSVPSIVVSQTLAIVLLVAIPNIQTFELVGAIYVIRTMLMNMSTPILTSFITGVVPFNERASALGISNSTGTVARSIGPAVGGYLMGQVSMAMPFYVCGVLYAVSTALFYGFFRKTRVDEKLLSSNSTSESRHSQSNKRAGT